LRGLAAIVFGVITFIVIAAWAVITGVIEIAAAIRLRRQIRGEWLLGLSGVLSIALGVLLMIRPGVGALAVVLWIGAYAIVFGILLVALSFSVHAWERTHRMPPFVPGHGIP
jgi:uncharacterized membrane protein HdeD (DUF308 family)